MSRPKIQESTIHVVYGKRITLYNISYVWNLSTAESTFIFFFFFISSSYSCSITLLLSCVVFFSIRNKKNQRTNVIKWTEEQKKRQNQKHHQNSFSEFFTHMNKKVIVSTTKLSHISSWYFRFIESLKAREIISFEMWSIFVWLFHRQSN